MTVMKVQLLRFLSRAWLLALGMMLTACAADGINDTGQPSAYAFPDFCLRSDTPQADTNERYVMDRRISCVLDVHKGKLYSIYNRRLRDNPHLSGNIVFALQLASDGTVLNVTVEKNELGDAQLVDELSGEFKRITFGPNPAGKIRTISIPISFLPPS